jgi:uncharacterized repeat protein (TIGR03803 family)
MNSSLRAFAKTSFSSIAIGGVLFVGSLLPQQAKAQPPYKPAYTTDPATALGAYTATSVGSSFGFYFDVKGNAVVLDGLGFSQQLAWNNGTSSVNQLWVNNTLYGTCSSGGTSNSGVIYSYNISASAYNFYSLSSTPSDSGLTLNSATNILYGVINPLLSASSIYSINTTFTTYTPINTTNVLPLTNRLYYNSSNNKLYGTSQYQTATTNFGTLFCLDNTGANYTTIYTFLNNNNLNFTFFV